MVRIPFPPATSGEQGQNHRPCRMEVAHPAAAGAQTGFLLGDRGSNPSSSSGESCRKSTGRRESGSGMALEGPVYVRLKPRGSVRSKPFRSTHHHRGPTASSRCPRKDANCLITYGWTRLAERGVPTMSVDMPPCGSWPSKPALDLAVAGGSINDPNAVWDKAAKDPRRGRAGGCEL